MSGLLEFLNQKPQARPDPTGLTPAQPLFPLFPEIHPEIPEIPIPTQPVHSRSFECRRGAETGEEFDDL